MQRHKALLLQAENFLDVLAKLYKLTITPPPILISPSHEFNALATDTDEIHLCLGVFEKAETYAGLAAGECEALDRDTLIRVKMKFIIFWVIAHEFFHIGRSHYAVYRLHGSVARKPIEFDADMMAIAGMYRWLRIINKNCTTRKTKGLILDSIFWPMRAHIGSAFAEAPDIDPDYPTWHLRIWTAFTKLIQMDNGTLTTEFPEEAQHDCHYLNELLVECDTAYCRYCSLPKSTLADFLNSYRNVSDFTPLSDSWESIRESVAKLERFTIFTS